MSETVAFPRSKARFSHYELREPLGRGGMGVVFDAHDETLQRRVAVKFLHRKFAERDGFVARFQREARAIAALVHPNIVRVYEAGVFEGTPFLVMEHLAGETLRRTIKRKGKIDFLFVLHVGLQVAEAVAAAHAAGILHRDIKPENVMLGREGHVWLLDFGLARADGGDAITREEEQLGTVRYLSPEQVLGRRPDGRADLFALGIVMHEMMTGRHPDEIADDPGASVTEILSARLHGEVVPVSRSIDDCPGSVVEIIHRLLQKEPAARYESGELVEVLRDVLRQTVPPEHPMVRRAEQARIEARRRRLAAGMAEAERDEACVGPPSLTTRAMMHAATAELDVARPATPVRSAGGVGFTMRLPLSPAGAARGVETEPLPADMGKLRASLPLGWAGTDARVAKAEPDVVTELGQGDRLPTLPPAPSPLANRATPGVRSAPRGWAEVPEHEVRSAAGGVGRRLPGQAWLVAVAMAAGVVVALGLTFALRGGRAEATTPLANEDGPISVAVGDAGTPEAMASATAAAASATAATASATAVASAAPAASASSPRPAASAPTLPAIPAPPAPVPAKAAQPAPPASVPAKGAVTPAPAAAPTGGPKALPFGAPLF